MNERGTNYRTKESKGSRRLDNVGNQEIENEKATTKNDGIFRDNEKQSRELQQIRSENNRNQANEGLDNSSFTL